MGISKRFCGAGKDWKQVGKATTLQKAIRWHHQLNGYEFEQARVLVTDRKAGQKRLSKWIAQFSWTRDGTGPSYIGSHFFFFSFLIVIRITLMAETVKSLFTKSGSQDRSWGASPGEGNGYPLQYCWLAVHGQRSLEGYIPWGGI